MIEDNTILHNQIAFDSVAPSVWGHLAEDVKGKESTEASEGDEEQGVEEAKPGKAEPPAATNTRGPSEAEITRQTGDTEVYKLYFSSIGWRMMGPFLCMTVLFVVFTKLPREFSLVFRYLDLVLADSNRLS